MWEYLSRIDNIVGLATFVLAGYAAWQLRRQHKRLREQAQRPRSNPGLRQYIERQRGIQTERSVALAISLLPNQPTIRHSVEQFLQFQQQRHPDQAQLWKAMPIEELTMTGINTEADREQFVLALQEKKRLINLAGYTEVHLFIAGPVVAGTIVGALLDNWLPVKLYHKPQASVAEVYEYWMPLIGT